jgi:hypothetical protein
MTDRATSETYNLHPASIWQQASLIPFVFICTTLAVVLPTKTVLANASGDTICELRYESFTGTVRTNEAASPFGLQVTHRCNEAVIL